MNGEIEKPGLSEDTASIKKEGDTDSIEADGGPPMKERETWNRSIDFLLACIGFSVGLGNVWRFPYLCYKNGGGAFLIPYLICVVIGGIPLFFLEVALGQFMSQGGIGAWKIVPLFQGIGWATTVIVFFLNCYYNVILCWAFYYMFASFTDVLPWSSCGNEWNTKLCTTSFAKDTLPQCNVTNVTMANGTMVSTLATTTMLANVTMENETMVTTLATTTMSAINATIPSNETVACINGSAVKLVDSVTEYWEHKVLGISEGIENVGTIKWDLALCLLLAWIVVYACICKGIRTSGKVMYVTATSPYIFMTILMIRGCTLPGAVDGIIFYLKPEMEKLGDAQVWVDAGTQIFFSYSISLGALTALGSYNKFHHNSYKDAIIFACTNSGTSIFAGFVIFSTLGYMAHEQGISVKDVAEGGPGLAFIAYPKALTEMPVAPLWSILFFLMIILLGLDSQFVGVEGLVTAFVDEYAHYLRRGYRREIFIGIVCLISFGIGLSMVTHGGMYVFQLFDYYSGSKIILFVAFFECIAIAWIYGVERFYDNMEMMYGFRINPYMKYCWCITAPAFCIITFILSVINYSELTYVRPSGEYVFPTWAVGIGWGMASLSAIWIPIIAVKKLIGFAQCGKALRLLILPENLKEHQLRPKDKIPKKSDEEQMQTFSNNGYTSSQDAI